MATNGGTTSASGLTSGHQWGSTLAGVFVSLVFYGVSILQTLIYYECHSKDRVMLKLLVAWVFVLNTLHTILITTGVWQYFVVHSGDESFLAYTHAPLSVSIAITSAVSSTVQLFFVYRIWFLTSSRLKWLFPAILVPFVIVQLVLGTFYTIFAMKFQISVTTISGPTLTNVANTINGAAMGVDVIITTSLCSLLAMGRTGHEDTDRMLLRLIFISVNTGLSSALFAFLAVVLLAIYPTDLIFTALYYPLCAVYCNTLLASLNARSFVRGHNETEQLGQFSSLVWQHNTAVSIASNLDSVHHTPSRHSTVDDERFCV